MFVTICGRFCPDEGIVAGYGNRIWAKYTAKWYVQIAGMIFQTRFKQSKKISVHFPRFWKCTDIFSLNFQDQKTSSVFSLH